MRQLFSGAILIMAVLSAGCVSTEFYAVSDTSGETGGITLVKSRTDTARNLFTHLKCTDMETCYKAFKREIIQSVDIQEKRFGFEPEITAKVAKMNVRFKEVPISYYPRTNEEGKKIGFSDGVRAIYCIWRYRK